MFAASVSRHAHLETGMARRINGYLETASLGALHWMAVGLALLTGLLHVSAGVMEGRPPVTLAGIGFLGAIGLFLFDYRRRQLYLVGIVYTLVQIPLWYVVKAGEYTPIGYLDKTIQGVLIVLLVMLYWTENRDREAHDETPSSVS